jgi:hypothetical protein
MASTPGYKLASFQDAFIALARTDFTRVPVSN